jgi:hypothetical protein
MPTLRWKGKRRLIYFPSINHSTTVLGASITVKESIFYGKRVGIVKNRENPFLAHLPPK